MRVPGCPRKERACVCSRLMAAPSGGGSGAFGAGAPDPLADGGCALQAAARAWSRGDAAAALKHLSLAQSPDGVDGGGQAAAAALARARGACHAQLQVRRPPRLMVAHLGQRGVRHSGRRGRAGGSESAARHKEIEQPRWWPPARPPPRSCCRCAVVGACLRPTWVVCVAGIRCTGVCRHLGVEVGASPRLTRTLGENCSWRSGRCATRARRTRRTLATRGARWGLCAR